MLLAKPPSYITTEQFRAMPLDYDLSSYTDPQIQDILNRASGAADALMRRSLLARERTMRYIGDGTNKLELRENPLLYVKRIQIVIPGSIGPLIPLDQILIDYQSGSVLQYTPLLWEGQGYFARFPDDIPVDVTLAYGYKCGVVKAPTWTSADTDGTGLAAGAYDIAITTRTMWGETTATPLTVTTATGNIVVTIAPVLGAYLYRAYVAEHGQTPLTLVAESPFTAYGTTAMTIDVNALTPQNGLWPDPLPTTDTSAPELPSAITEAVRLLALNILWEQNNLANRGVAKTESGRKSIAWRSTEGSAGKGVPLAVQQATALLKPYSLQAIY